ncbi:MAG: hypothetical protein ACRDQA_00290 [Nocardioidaceae bacterium]
MTTPATIDPVTRAEHELDARLAGHIVDTAARRRLAQSYLADLLGEGWRPPPKRPAALADVTAAEPPPDTYRQARQALAHRTKETDHG